MPLSTICVRREMPSRFINSWANVTSRERLAKSFRASSLASILDDWIRSWSCWAFWALRAKDRRRNVHRGKRSTQKIHVSFTEKQSPRAQKHKTICVLHVPGKFLPQATSVSFTMEIRCVLLMGLIFPSLGKARAQQEQQSPRNRKDGAVTRGTCLPCK